MTHRLVATCRLVALSAGLLAGCFADPINQPPGKPTITQPTPLYRGDTASFTVTVSDPDQDPLVVTWGELAGGCPPGVTYDNWQGGHVVLMQGEPLVVGPDVTGSPFCVCTFVTDSHHAVNQDCQQVTPQNRPPANVTIMVVEPTVVPLFALYSTFHLSVSGMDPDNDPLTFGEWTLVTPDAGSHAALASCPSAGDPDVCFTADEQGEYILTVTARDGHGGEATAMRSLTVDKDRLPCLGSTTPAADQTMRFALSSETVRFEVNSIDDDGNSSLSGPDRIHFTWWEGPANGPLINQGNDLSVFSRVPEQTLVGQTRRVRVEIHDRNVDKIDQELAGCMDADICLADGRSGCFLRWTWSVVYR